MDINKQISEDLLSIEINLKDERFGILENDIRLSGAMLMEYDNMKKIRDVYNEKYHKKKSEINKKESEVAKLKNASLVSSGEKKEEIDKAIEMKKNNIAQLKPESSIAYREKAEANKDVKKEQASQNRLTKLKESEDLITSPSVEPDKPETDKEELHVPDTFELERDDYIEESVSAIAYTGESGKVANIILNGAKYDDDKLHKLAELLKKSAVFKNTLYKYKKEIERTRPNNGEVRRIKKQLVSLITRYKNRK